MALIHAVVISITLVGCGRIGFDAFEPMDDDADGSSANRNCAPSDDDTLALFSFDSTATIATDSANNHPAELRGPGVLTQGPSGCDTAFEVPAGGGSYVLVDDDADWQLGVGSVDFWFRVAEGTPDSAILSRDADGAAKPGHLGVLFWNREVVVRIQDQSSPSGGLFRCTAAIDDDEWHHLGVNFGPPEFEVVFDGVRTTRTDQVSLSFGVAPCGVLGTASIEGNNNTWVIGGDNGDALEDSSDPFVNGMLRGGAIDHVRISSARRDFTGVAGAN